MAHETCWKYVIFVDPCTEEERVGFDLCNHYCKSEEHVTGSARPAKSYCSEKLWHQPIMGSGKIVSTAGYISGDGHRFPCDHSKNVPHHVIFIIDRSGSMYDDDRTPTLVKFNSLRCRLGCVYEDILKFIQIRLKTVCDDAVSVVLFDESAQVVAEMEDMKEGIVDRLLPWQPHALTNFSSGLNAAEKILMKGSRHPSVNLKIPFAILLTDGGNNSGEDPIRCVEKMKRGEPGMKFHTILFSSGGPETNILSEMAKKGSGEFYNALDELQLARTFENLANSLKPQVAALM